MKAIIITFPTTDEECEETGNAFKDTDIFRLCDKHFEMVVDSWQEYIESIDGIFAKTESIVEHPCCCCVMDEEFPDDDY